MRQDNLDTERRLRDDCVGRVYRRGEVQKCKVRMKVLRCTFEAWHSLQAARRRGAVRPLLVASALGLVPASEDRSAMIRSGQVHVLDNDNTMYTAVLVRKLLLTRLNCVIAEVTQSIRHAVAFCILRPIQRQRHQPLPPAWRCGQTSEDCKRWQSDNHQQLRRLATRPMQSTIPVKPAQQQLGRCNPSVCGYFASLIVPCPPLIFSSRHRLRYRESFDRLVAASGGAPT